MAGNVAEYVADWFNQDFDDALKDGSRNPPLATKGSPIPYEPELKISKGEHWNRDVGGQRIRERRPMRPYSATNRDGVRFAVDAATLRAYLARDTASQVEKK